MGGARPSEPGGPGRRRSIGPWLWAVFVAAMMLALINSYGRAMATFAQDLWGPDLTYYDNGTPVLAKLHRLPGPGDPGQAPAGTGWPETVLRPACFYTLNLMGLSGPEGGLWTASVEGEGLGQRLVVRATAGGNVVGRYRVVGGLEDTGLAVVELDAGPNGLHLMDVFQPREGAGWFVIQPYRVVDKVGG
ncbi:MAG: hypothetical protein C4551_05270 [Bacillota bacterium]|nr:MAG: hypothetical protein C4551_05270 [Bacillota bacterium]